MSFLQDDKEFIEALKEAHVLGSGVFFKEVICYYVVILINE